MWLARSRTIEQNNQGEDRQHHEPRRHRNTSRLLCLLRLPPRSQSYPAGQESRHARKIQTRHIRKRQSKRTDRQRLVTRPGKQTGRHKRWQKRDGDHNSDRRGRKTGRIYQRSGDAGSKRERNIGKTDFRSRPKLGHIGIYGRKGSNEIRLGETSPPFLVCAARFLTSSRGTTAYSTTARIVLHFLS